MKNIFFHIIDDGKLLIDLLYEKVGNEHFVWQQMLPMADMGLCCSYSLTLEHKCGKLIQDYENHAFMS